MNISKTFQLVCSSLKSLQLQYIERECVCICLKKIQFRVTIKYKHEGMLHMFSSGKKLNASIDY